MKELCVTDRIHYQDSFEYTVEFTNAEGKRVEDTVTLSKPYSHVADVFEWIERKHLVCDNMEITDIFVNSFPF